MEMADLIEQGLAATAGKPGWRYFDLPNMRLDLYDELLAIIGEANVAKLTDTVRTWPDGSMTRRGQILISPEGMANLEKRRATNV